MKKHNTSSATTLSSERDNKKTKTSPALAKAWLAKHNKADCLKTSRTFDVLLDRTLKRIVPDGSMSGVLQGFECETRQRAAQMLFDKYLAGNKGLLAATGLKSQAKVRRFLAQAIFSAVKYSRLNILHREERVAIRHRFTDDVDYYDRGIIIHPSERRHLWDLPVELQIQLVYAGLGLAVRENNIPRGTADMIRTLIEEDCSVSEIAERINISAQAAHKRIKRAGVYLKKFVDENEFPM